MGAGTQEMTMTAPDISCEHCVATAEREVGSIAGVEKVNASAVTKQVAVTFDAGRVSRSQIEAVMSKAGHPVRQ